MDLRLRKTEDKGMHIVKEFINNISSTSLNRFLTEQKIANEQRLSFSDHRVLLEQLCQNDRFIDHLRFTVDNTPGKIVKEYLLPNFVAGCCKKVGIDGIKYQGDGYNCYVTWKDDYFSFEGNDIVEVEGP